MKLVNPVKARECFGRIVMSNVVATLIGSIHCDVSRDLIVTCAYPTLGMDWGGGSGGGVERFYEYCSIRCSMPAFKMCVHMCVYACS